MKEYNCDLCGNEEAIEVPYARLYTGNQPIHICVNCGFVYVRNRRSAKEVADSWSDDIYGEGYTARIPAVKARQVYVADFLDVNIGLKNKKLIDIGAGEGQFLEIARDQYGADVFGIEPSKKNCDTLIKNGFKCFNGTIEEFQEKKPAQKAEIVSIMWTLENCASCRNMLDSAYDITEENGHIIVATGSRILVPFKKVLGDYLSKNPADTHSFRWSANTLKGILAVSGFKTIFINKYQDTDYLCVIGEKKENKNIAWEGDNYLQVYNFFERWHHESVYY